MNKKFKLIFITCSNLILFLPIFLSTTKHILVVLSSLYLLLTLLLLHSYKCIRLQISSYIILYIWFIGMKMKEVEMNLFMVIFLSILYFINNIVEKFKYLIFEKRCFILVHTTIFQNFYDITHLLFSLKSSLQSLLFYSSLHFIFPAKRQRYLLI